MKNMTDILNYIAGKECAAESGRYFDKLNPDDGTVLCRVARSEAKDVENAIDAAVKAYPEWAARTEVSRGDMLRDVALKMRDRKKEIAEIVSAETGKSLSNALGETDAAIEMGMFIAGEGRRYYGRTTTATMANRRVMTIRKPVGIAGLIIASNTPIANVAWKAFPSMFCGNASIMKPSEDTPATAWIFAKICHEVGVPAGVFNVVQGLGPEAGMPLVESKRVKLISFTGSCETGKKIQQAAAPRLAKICMELGGKNALVVCDDADLDNAVKWALQSSFSNAGQRCAASSRIIVMDKVYDKFKTMFAETAGKLKVGTSDDDFYGPVINLKQIEKMADSVSKAVAAGAKLICGGSRVADARHKNGFYMAPTLLENTAIDSEISRTELFGPVAILYKAGSFDDALAMANNSDYGLTSSIHTSNLHRAMQYAERVEAGVVVINGGTHGSEPHMGFGGVKNSGTGWKEAGVEALDVYSETKYVNIITDPKKA